jgi:diguanylate cyclase (GGDEF)-like protein/PAS domain S-box-containing protein
VDALWARDGGRLIDGPDVIAEPEAQTAEKTAEEALARLASIVQSSDDAIVAFAPDGIATSWNPGAEAVYGYAADEMVGSSAEQLIPANRMDEHRRNFDRVVAGEHIEHFESERVRNDGRVIDVSLTMSPIHDTDGRLIGVSTIARDVTERKRFETQLQRLANHDPLTDLYNRRRLEEELAAKVAHAKRYGTGGALLILDLDNFKYVNDVFGHGAGDQLLRDVASLLRMRLRETDVVARLGGDEFAVLLPDADVARARKVASDVLEEVRGRTLVAGAAPLRTTASIGVVVYDRHTASAGELLADADRAMYEAKDAGRDRAVLQSESTTRARRDGRASWEHRIRQALHHDLFALHCQPILDVRRNEISQWELLLRMRGPEGDTPPGAFLGVAERLGLIHSIDRWVITEAVRLLAEHPDVTLEINISACSVDDERLLDMIRSELENASVNPTRLIFEITETAAIANMDQARHLSQSLTRLGCRFALDDFGTGFGSFYYLKHMPADYLKIDGDFIRSPRSRADELVVESIVRIAQGLGKRTIAEFVEDPEALTSVREQGVDFAQGYFVGRPGPVTLLAFERGTLWLPAV